MNTNTDKINAIETNIEKSKVREEIISQVIQYVNDKGIKNLQCVTLPAEHYIFEHQLAHQLQNSPFVKSPTNVNFLCAEMDREILIKGLKYKPDCCVVTHSTIEDLLKFGGIEQSNFFGFDLRKHLGSVCSGNSKASSPQNPHFVWADYCRQPTKEVIKNGVKACLSKKSKEGLYYFTFSLSRIWDGQDSLKKSLSIHVNGECDSKIAVEMALEREFRKEVPQNTPVSKIYSVKYTGGVRSIMVTIGFLVGLANVKTINNVRWNKEIQKNRQKATNRMNSLKLYPYDLNQWEEKNARFAKPFAASSMPKKVKKDIVKVNPVKNVNKQLIKSAWDKGNISDKNKAAFCISMATKLSMSSRQVQSILAWHTSPTLKAKSLN